MRVRFRPLLVSIMCGCGIFVLWLSVNGTWEKLNILERSRESDITRTAETSTPDKIIDVREKSLPKTPGKENSLPETPEKENSLPDATYPDWFKEAWQRSPVRQSEEVFVGDKPLYGPACQTTGKAKGYPYIEPKPYIPESKNPCWFENPKEKKRLRCLPYFYVAGVAKCGTTDLYRRLRLHPDIMRGSMKEYHFWDRERFETTEILKGRETTKHRKAWTFEHYVELIMADYGIETVNNELKKNGTVKTLFGDGSPAYLWDILFWELLQQNEGCSEPRIVVGQHMYHVYPEAKIFLIFRHPTPRLYSRFLSRLWRTPYLKGSTSASFHDYVAKGVQLYKDCFKKHSIRQCAYNYTIYDKAVVRLVEGMYPVFMADWLRIWPRDQMLLLRSEDYKEDMEGTLMKAFDFLGVAKLSRAAHDRVVEHTQSNVGTEYGNLGPMLPETVKILDEFYQPFVDKFAEILQDPRFLWKDTYPPKTE